MNERDKIEEVFGLSILENASNRIEPVLGDWDIALKNDSAIDPPIGNIDDVCLIEPPPKRVINERMPTLSIVLVISLALLVGYALGVITQ